MIRVLLADDHPIVRAGLSALLANAADIDVIGEVAKADDAVAWCADTDRSPQPDVVLMDLRFGEGMSGVEATRRIHGLPRAPHLLVVTNYDTDADILAAIEAGASGYLLKDTAPAELLAAIRAAAAGESALSPSVATRLLTRVRATPDTVLTPREIDVVAQVATGRSNREIAKALHVSEMTVKSHLVHIFTKLGVGSRTAAVASARRQGLID
ncbi:response regulator transcription factor [Gordonia jacobaea]|uniref:response regulator transcription factor n=1 Tax=Gordonia jacobaea TaxID=122202 RepID=UPI003D746C22